MLYRYNNIVGGREDEQVTIVRGVLQRARRRVCYLHNSEDRATLVHRRHFATYTLYVFKGTN